MTSATTPSALKRPNDHGRSAESPWQMPASGWKDILLRTWKESSKDNVGLVAAGVAFYAFLAIVPLLEATVLTYGLIASPHAVIANMESLTHVLPANIAKLIGEQLMSVVHTSGGKKGLGVLVALAVTLFGARNAAGSIVIALNIAYEEEEKRGFLKVTLLALAITAAAVVLALLAIAAIGVLQFIGRLLPHAPAVALLGKVLTPVLLAVGAAAAAAALYRYGPSREKAQWTWLTPGSLFSAIGWLVVTAGFGIYVTRFAHYDATYGSLGAVVALLTWIYLSSYVFLFGAELNSEFEHQTAKDTTQGTDDPLGQRGAWSADHVAAGADDEGKEADQGSPSPLSIDPSPRTAPPPSPSSSKPASEHAYLASRVTSHGARMAGLAKVGTLSSILSTTGLAMLRRKGSAKAGAALLAAAAGLALLRREKQVD
ncbi:MAG: YihY/virulence factor BrkB family protein [Sphingomicrobium sp.]|nr:YihY/virulence factor BrkB family protein [Sphingomonadales bacterium]